MWNTKAVVTRVVCVSVCTSTTDNCRQKSKINSQSHSQPPKNDRVVIACTKLGVELGGLCCEPSTGPVLGVQARDGDLF